MCLIMFSPQADLPAKLDFQSAAADNSDGIGIMSADGIGKFNGKRATRRAWKYAQYLAQSGVPFAVHFRYATHGDVCRELTHPFQVPETSDYVMHNGILSQTAKYATDSDSDTSLFVREYLPYYSDRRTDRAAWLEEVENDTWGSKLVVMSDDGSAFDIVHERMGDWCSGIWFSNTYSLVAPETRAIHWRPAPVARATVPRMLTRHGRGFDWQDVSTWHLYASQKAAGAALNRFGSDDAVSYDEYASWRLGDPEPFSERDRTDSD